MDTRDVNIAIKALKDGKRVGKNKWIQKKLFNSLKDYELAYKEGHLFNIWELR